ncbi:OsmC family protein [Flavobacterium agricola]|uniref:OsmC family protein n=1 Tax=Flavobacterium agricola TaxID=2870839 RepID=A0ABY6LZF0_9FLAO|nr:OsmC family protein [Flavobacterium agricola]UYW00825.1 OsmC family protein [Flavobacterium agricola]
MAQVKASIKNNTYKTDLITENISFIADEPAEKGGTNLGPNPKELLVGALASCTAITVRMYANRKEWPLQDVLVDITLDEETTPGTAKFIKKIEFVGPELTEEMKTRLYTIADKCPVNKILNQPIAVVK